MNKLDFAEHKELGKFTSVLRNRLLEEECDIFNNAPTKVMGRKLARHEHLVVKALEIMKDHLEEIMFRDYPELSTSDVYYGGVK